MGSWVGMINIREQADNRLLQIVNDSHMEVQDAISINAWDRRDTYLRIYKEAKYELLRRELDEYFINAYSSQRFYEKDVEEPVLRKDVNDSRYSGFRGLE